MDYKKFLKQTIIFCLNIPPSTEETLSQIQRLLAGAWKHKIWFFRLTPQQPISKPTRQIYLHPSAATVKDC